MDSSLHSHFSYNRSRLSLDGASNIIQTSRHSPKLSSHNHKLAKIPRSNLNTKPYHSSDISLSRSPSDAENTPSGTYSKLSNMTSRLDSLQISRPHSQNTFNSRLYKPQDSSKKRHTSYTINRPTHHAFKDPSNSNNFSPKPSAHTSTHHTRPQQPFRRSTPTPLKRDLSIEENSIENHNLVKIPGNGQFSLPYDDSFSLFDSEQNNSTPHPPSSFRSSPPKRQNLPLLSSPLTNRLSQNYSHRRSKTACSPDFELYHDTDIDFQQSTLPHSSSLDIIAFSKNDSLSSSASNISTTSSSSQSTEDTEHSYNLFSSFNETDSSSSGLAILAPKTHSSNIQYNKSNIGGFSVYNSLDNAFSKSSEYLDSTNFLSKDSTRHARVNSKVASSNKEPESKVALVKRPVQVLKSSPVIESGLFNSPSIQQLGQAFSVDAQINSDDEKESNCDYDINIVKNKYPTGTLKLKHPPKDLVEAKRLDSYKEILPRPLPDLPLNVPKQRKKYKTPLLNPKIATIKHPPSGLVSALQSSNTSPVASPNLSSQQLHVRKTRYDKCASMDSDSDSNINPSKTQFKSATNAPRRDIREVRISAPGNTHDHSSRQHSSCSSSPLPYDALHLNIGNDLTETDGSVDTGNILPQNNNTLATQKLTTHQRFAPLIPAEPVTSDTVFSPVSVSPLSPVLASGLLPAYDTPSSHMGPRIPSRSFANGPYSPQLNTFMFQEPQPTNLHNVSTLNSEDVYDHSDRFEDAEDDENESSFSLLSSNDYNANEATEPSEPSTPLQMDADISYFSHEITNSPPTPEPILLRKQNRLRNRKLSDGDIDKPTTPMIRRSKRIKEKERDPRPRSPGRRCIPRHNEIAPIKSALKNAEGEPKEAATITPENPLPSPIKRAIPGVDDQKAVVVSMVAGNATKALEENEQSKRRRTTPNTPQTVVMQERYPSPVPSAGKLHTKEAAYHPRKKLGFYTVQDLREFEKEDEKLDPVDITTPGITPTPESSCDSLDALKNSPSYSEKRLSTSRPCEFERIDEGIIGVNSNDTSNKGNTNNNGNNTNNNVDNTIQSESVESKGQLSIHCVPARRKRQTAPSRLSLKPAASIKEANSDPGPPTPTECRLEKVTSNGIESDDCARSLTASPVPTLSPQAKSLDVCTPKYTRRTGIKRNSKKHVVWAHVLEW